MSQLSDISILEAMDRGHINIEPWQDALLQPASVDLTLGNSWLVPIKMPAPVSVKLRNAAYQEVELPTLTLAPGEFVLATTHEVVTLGNHTAAKFEGKSSLGRLGLMTHVTAGFIDPGFSGQITLEIYNCGHWELELETGIKIGQLVFTHLDTPVSEGYGAAKWGSRYHGQRGATGAKQ